METEIFTCKYFKFGRNTTGLSQSHLRNFLACSIKYLIPRKRTQPWTDCLSHKLFIDIAPVKVFFLATALYVVENKLRIPV